MREHTPSDNNAKFAFLFAAQQLSLSDSRDLVAAANQIKIMVFNGAEAFKNGASAPSLEREVSGKCPKQGRGAMIGDVSVFFETHNKTTLHSSSISLVTSNNNRVLLDSQELNAASGVSFT